jgi:hypothetical protein
MGPTLGHHRPVTDIGNLQSLLIVASPDETARRERRGAPVRRTNYERTNNCSSRQGVSVRIERIMSSTRLIGPPASCPVAPHRNLRFHPDVASKP